MLLLVIGVTSSGERYCTSPCAADSPSLVVLSKLVGCGVDLEARSLDFESWTCSICQVARDNAEALLIFLQAGADVNGIDADHDSLVHKSIILSRYDCAVLLRAARADLTARDGGGRTAFLVAAQKQSKLVDFLLAVGANLDAVDEIGQTSRVFGGASTRAVRWRA
jgi:ankyrin repeat protein